MTATEQLRHQLDAMPPDLREAEAERRAERSMIVQEAVDGLRRLSKRQTLGEDLTIRDLIEDGRRM